MNDAVMQITKGEEIIFVHYIYTWVIIKIFVMLSEYINRNKAYFNAYSQILTLSYTD